MTVESRLQILRGLPVFKDLDEGSLRILAEHAQEEEYAQGQNLAREGQVGSGLFVILKGTVSIVRHGVQVDTSGPGDVIGEMSVLDRALRVATLTASEPVTCLTVAAWDIPKILEQPDLAQIVRRVEQAHRTREEERRASERRS